jgi:hypothetical protein
MDRGPLIFTQLSIFARKSAKVSRGFFTQFVHGRRSMAEHSRACHAQPQMG